MINRQKSSIDPILDDKVFLGNLASAFSPLTHSELGITHILSVCPEYPPSEDSICHKHINVQDSEYDDLLIHLQDACDFIQQAIDEGGKVLVHCVMGISRSTTVVCAYLMRSRRITASAAISFVKQRRPCVCPNYGFIKQLHAFAQCNYEPSSTNPAYISWKRKHRQDVTKYLRKVDDTSAIIADKLIVTSEFPKDDLQAEALIMDLGITHLLTLSPTQIPGSLLVPLIHKHIEVSDNCHESLLFTLSDACAFIARALHDGGQVLVHSLIDVRVTTVAGAYLMQSNQISYKQALDKLEEVLPLFNRTENISKHLELFATCHFAPTRSDPAVQAWLGTDDPVTRARSRSNATLAFFDEAARRLFEGTGLDAGALTHTISRIQERGTAVRA